MLWQQALSLRASTASTRCSGWKGKGHSAAHWQATWPNYLVPSSCRRSCCQCPTCSSAARHKPGAAQGYSARRNAACRRHTHGMLDQQASLLQGGTQELGELRSLLAERHCLVLCSHSVFSCCTETRKQVLSKACCKCMALFFETIQAWRQLLYVCVTKGLAACIRSSVFECCQRHL